MIEDEGWEDRIRQLAAARQNGQRTGGAADDGHIFITVQGDPDEIRQPRFAWDGRVLLGAWNVLVGSGGVGKGLLVAWLVAGWTRGGLPGHFQGNRSTS